MKDEKDLLPVTLIPSILSAHTEKLEGIKTDYAGLIITDHTDKDQIKVVQAAATEARKLRVDIRAKVKNIKKAITNFSKQLTTEGESLANNANLFYLELKEKADAAILKAENEAAAIEAERVEKVLSKVNLLLDAGFLSNGVQYIAGTVIVDSNALDHMEETELLELIEKGKEENRRIADILATVKTEPIEPEAVEPKIVPEQTEAERIQQAIDDLPFGDVEPETTTVYKPTNVGHSEAIGHTLKNQTPEPVTEADQMQGITKDFKAGWDGCRAAVVDLLRTGEPMTRAALIELILDLRPE